MDDPKMNSDGVEADTVRLLGADDGDLCPQGQLAGATIVALATVMGIRNSSTALSISELNAMNATEVEKMKAAMMASAFADTKEKMKAAIADAKSPMEAINELYNDYLASTIEAPRPTDVDEETSDDKDVSGSDGEGEDAKSVTAKKASVVTKPPTVAKKRAASAAEEPTPRKMTRGATARASKEVLLEEEKKNKNTK